MTGATKLGYWRLGYSDTGGSDTGGLEATRLAGQGLEAWGDCLLVGVGDWLCSHTLDALERSADKDSQDLERILDWDRICQRNPNIPSGFCIWTRFVYKFDD